MDLRGSGDPEGVLEDEYLEQGLQDGIAVIVWLAEQPWCDGNVGMIGISWGGFNGLQIAARQPEALKAVVSVCSTDDRYATAEGARIADRGPHGRRDHGSDPRHIHRQSST